MSKEDCDDSSAEYDGCATKKEPMGNNENSQIVRFGFASNRCQLVWHFLLAVFIGISLKMTTFKDATIAAEGASKYQQQTAFLISFGFTKALSNLLVGRVSDVYGRKLPHTMGWVAGVILGMMLLATEARGETASNDWNWTLYVLANIFLGAQQGWTWTTNIFMWMDVLGPNHRALASGISNSVGYLSSAFATYLAAALSIRSAFLVVLASSVMGLAISIILVQDTTQFIHVEVLEQQQQQNRALNEYDDDDDDDDDTEWNTKRTTTELAKNNNEKKNRSLRQPEYDLVANCENNHNGMIDSSLDMMNPKLQSSFGSVFCRTCWQNKSTAVLCLSGLMTNLITSLAWGLVLIWGHQQSLSELRLANIGSAFTFSKAIAMIFSAQISDSSCHRKQVLVCGFCIAILGLLLTSMADHSVNNSNTRIFVYLLVGGIVIGSGIGCVYPVMTGAIGDHTIPQNRASAIGVYKLFRDSGYAFGGLLTGWIADLSGGSFLTVVWVVAVLVGILVVLLQLFYQEAAVTVTKQDKTITSGLEAFCDEEDGADDCNEN